MSEPQHNTDDYPIVTLETTSVGMEEVVEELRRLNYNLENLLHRRPSVELTLPPEILRLIERLWAKHS